jgi:3-hydroxyisobutyrate dehydrogenase
MYFTTPTKIFITRRNLQGSLIIYNLTHQSAVGFIGLGQMGKPMARNLVKNGFDVMVYDVDQQAASGFSRVGKSVKDIAKNNQMIFTMLPNNKIVRDVYRGPNGLLANAKRGTLLIDCSTIEFDAAQELHKDAKVQNLNMIDAPVSGGMQIMTYSY